METAFYFNHIYMILTIIFLMHFIRFLMKCAQIHLLIYSAIRKQYRIESSSFDGWSLLLMFSWIVALEIFRIQLLN